MTVEKLLHLILYSRDRVLYDGPVESISSVNGTGKFDILSRHSNFISLIKDKITIRVPNKPEEEILIRSGILRVHSNDVEVFLGVGS